MCNCNVTPINCRRLRTAHCTLHLHLAFQRCSSNTYAMARNKKAGSPPGSPKKHKLPAMRGRALHSPSTAASLASSLTISKQKLASSPQKQRTLEVAVQYVLSILSIVAPTLLRPWADHNIVVMQQNRYSDVLLPAIEDVRRWIQRSHAMEEPPNGSKKAAAEPDSDTANIVLISHTSSL